MGSPYSFAGLISLGRTKFAPGNEDVVINQMVTVLNAAAPIAHDLRDYWTFDGWFALKRRLEMPGSGSLQGVVFPGNELRLVSTTRPLRDSFVRLPSEAETDVFCRLAERVVRRTRPTGGVALTPLGQRRWATTKSIRVVRKARAICDALP